MLHYIKGYITDTMVGAVAIETGGVAFAVNVPDNSPAYLAAPDELVTLYTAMIVREDDISLYGFTDKQSLALFRQLMTVQGIGAKAALAILSVLSSNALVTAILSEDVDSITKANGIGKKTAQRVVMELKEKLEKQGYTATVTDLGTDKHTAERQEAISALVALGYSKQEAMAALAGIKAETTEEYIRQALKNR